ncbi:MAG: GIY-YIG nuclease family protein [Deltaproteobacteria bacterium]|nr:GIY-YIG nuclease family protein [Deltaproteobacteria bacterium]
MFKTYKIKTDKHLRELLDKLKAALLNSLQIVNYPTSLRGKAAIFKWNLNYKEIDKINNELLKNISNKAGVYLLSTYEGRRRKILYIGQTQSKTARQRIRSHIVWRNKKTKSGKITGSQFDKVQKIIVSGKKLNFSFVEIQPASLRHYIEENLIEELNPPWNKHKTSKYLSISFPIS